MAQRNIVGTLDTGQYQEMAIISESSCCSIDLVPFICLATA